MKINFRVLIKLIFTIIFVYIFIVIFRFVYNMPKSYKQFIPSSDIISKNNIISDKNNLFVQSAYSNKDDTLIIYKLDTEYKLIEWELNSLIYKNFKNIEFFFQNNIELPNSGLPYNKIQIGEKSTLMFSINDVINEGIKFSFIDKSTIEDTLNNTNFYYCRFLTTKFQIDIGEYKKKNYIIFDFHEIKTEIDLLLMRNAQNHLIFFLLYPISTDKLGNYKLVDILDTHRIVQGSYE